MSITSPRLPHYGLRLALTLLGWGLIPLPALANPEAPIRVLAHVPSRVYYVGQSIELRIGVEAGGERPEVIPPSIPHVDIDPIDASFSPVEATGIGGLTAERNLFISRFRLIPRRAGALQIPPVRVRLDGRKGASLPLRIDVRSLPLVGRPADFLGGVGAFAVEAEASPKTVRAGQELTYTIRVTGPAARGMTSAPRLSRFAQVPLGLEVEPRPIEARNSPPSRQFQYQIRPTRAGRASLPPVAIAAFDPQAGRYVTRVTSSIPIRVVEVPIFDPANLDYSSPPSPPTIPRRLSAPGGRIVAVLTLAIACIIASAFALRSFSNRRKFDPGRLLLRRARRLDPGLGADRTALFVAESLAEYLERAIGRPRGVLTPGEAREGIVAATGIGDLGTRCARLVAACDRIRYSKRAQEPCTSDLVDEARRVFEEIGRSKRDNQGV